MTPSVMKKVTEKNGEEKQGIVSPLHIINNDENKI